MIGLLANFAAPAFEFDYNPTRGLSVTTGGIEIVRGSMFQYYAPGWTKGYYSSRWNGQRVEKPDADTIKVSYRALGDQVFGTATYRRVGNQLLIDFELGWKGSEPAKVELCPALIWTAPFENGFVNGTTLTDKSTGTIEARTIATGNLDLDGPAVSLRVSGDQAIRTFDARNYSQDWAAEQPLFWQGLGGVDVKEGAPTKVHLEYTFSPKPRPAVNPTPIQTKPSQAESLFPNSEMPVLIPKPKNSILDWNTTAEITGKWEFPAGKPKFFDWFEKKLKDRFYLPIGTIGVQIDGGMSDLNKRPGGYKLVIAPGKISLYGEREEGLRNGFARLTQLMFVRKGKLVVPTGIIDDEPRTDFRGVHLFVGPQAPEFQKKLWDNVLLPLGMNKVVLQCERTEWKTLPATRDEMTMKQSDLVGLFNWYRKQQVEPIPLIQSFGHMEWFFARGANLDLAYNRNVPYAIDPRKPEAVELIGKLWDEAVTVLRPKTIHFGLDEVDMRGFEPKDPKLTTELWQLLLPELGKIAKRIQTGMMLWGDKGLAPGEAVDAALGDDLKNAQARRAAIPKGSYIADWHYKGDQNHTPFLKSLQTWKLADMIPIASTWYQPENIRGFGVASDIEGVGMLQTTWAGYESNELNMLKAIHQFSAMVYAADYAWSGRTERIEELPYRADEVFARMYNPRPSVLTPTKLWQLGSKEPFTVGDIAFNRLEGGQLAGISQDNFGAPASLSIPMNNSAKEIFLALNCAAQTKLATPVGQLEIRYQDGTTEAITLQYGLHVRAANEKKAVFFGQSGSGYASLRFPTKALPIKSITIKATDLTVGLNLGGVAYR